MKKRIVRYFTLPIPFQKSMGKSKNPHLRQGFGGQAKVKAQNRRKVFVTHTSKQTKQLGFILGREVLQGRPHKQATVIGLQGELGSGKTTFVQGFAKGLGIKEKILSPTFVIIKKYEIPSFAPTSPRLRWASKASEGKQDSRFSALYHIDCYRIKDEKDLVSLWWDKIASDPKNLVLIEWPERIQKILPKETVSISFKTTTEHKRKITFFFEAV